MRTADSRFTAAPIVECGYVNLYVRDVTEQKWAEEQLRQSQKMEAVGQLAGGVAHHFRNQLTVIQGYGGMLLRRSLVKEEGVDKLQEILKAAERSTLLTGQLLAFSRKQTLELQKVNLTELIADISKSIPQMVGGVRFLPAAGGEAGIVYTRTGRRFFDDAALEAEFLSRVRSALDASDFWARFETTWACLDCELMPWSAKAQELLKSQYAAVGAAGRASLPEAVTALNAATQRTGNVLSNPASATAILERYTSRQEAIELFIASYRQYCWPVNSLDDLKLAPFHLMATEGKVHVDYDHTWHMDTLAEICRHEPRLLLATPYKVVDVTDPASQDDGTNWWLELTGRGGEGMVV